MIVEILSDGNNRVELQNKFELYQEYGVREYWVIQSFSCTFLIYALVEGEFQPSRLFTVGDTIQSSVIVGFELDLEEVFKV